MSVRTTRAVYKQSGLLPSPEVSSLTAIEANTLLTRWHYLGPVRGVIAAFGHDEGCLVFTNLRSRVLESRHPKSIELARMVGVDNHTWAMSSLMSKVMKEVRLLGYTRCYTYSDPLAGHNGMVYLAAGWVDDGVISKDGHPLLFIDGKRISPRTLYDRHGTQSVPFLRGLYGERLRTEPKPLKHRFYKDL
jgi:hypothetical protein